MGHALRMTSEQVEKHNARVKGKPKAESSSLCSGSAQPGDGSASRPDYEAWLERQLLAAGVHGFERQYFWCRGRKFCADFAFVEPRLLVEVDGGAHRIKARFKADIDKSQQAILQSWTLLRVSTEQVRTGEAARIVQQVHAMTVCGRAPF